MNHNTEDIKRDHVQAVFQVPSQMCFWFNPQGGNNTFILRVGEIEAPSDEVNGLVLHSR